MGLIERTFGRDGRGRWWVQGVIIEGKLLLWLNFSTLIVIPLVLLRNCILKPREMQMEGSRYNYFFQDLFCGREQVKGLHFFPTDQRSSEPCSVFSTDDGNNKFRILQVNYSHHIIFYLENFSDSFQLLELYSRVFSCWRSSWGGEAREGRKPADRVDFPIVPWDLSPH